MSVRHQQPVADDLGLACNPYAECIRLLAARGASVNACEGLRRLTPIFIAASLRGVPAAVSSARLSKLGPTYLSLPTAAGAFGGNHVSSPIEMATLLSNAAALRELLRAAQPALAMGPATPGKNRSNPLHLAAVAGARRVGAAVECAAVLLDQGPCRCECGG